ncbi:conserved hypothetical protein [uncultured Desulfobacterium sp.]|uniref:Type I restriction modification DNA specificity domain-containing protein n=1 Tax=uncultured Desulfobacterium sp. TaxID=201089 RepID=A0A445MTQ6_9BACT|nr:conserved hypothetical protein [uncultured Desulfobacterium sp.]
MDTKKFLAEFRHIVNAPGGVQRLRHLVLYLAVSGKLCPISKGHGSDFKTEIDKVRTQLIKDKTIKPNKKVLLVRDDVPFDIPDNWVWCRFGDLCHFSAGRTPSRKESIFWNTGDYPWFSITDMKHGKVISDSSETVSEEARSKVFKCPPVKASTLLMSFKLTIGKVSITGVDAYHNEAIIAIYPFVEDLKAYFFKCLNGFALTAGNKAAIKGKTLNQDSISNIYIALPPKEEIGRVVAKVDELMSLCDKLEFQQEKRRNLQTRARTVVLEEINKAQGSHELKEAWLRLQANLLLLLDGPEDIETVRNAIMNALIRGQLTRRSKVNASELVEMCRKHKEKLIKEKILQKQKPYSKHREYPFSLPENWAWVRFSEVGTLARGKSKHRPRNDPKLFIDGKYPFIQTGDVARAVGKGITNYSKKYSEFGLSQSQLWQPGTLCITIAANIADSAILKIEACFPDSVVGFIPFEAVGCVEYFDLFVRTAKSTLIEYAPSTAQKNINLGILEQIAVPLPPRNEMEKIVAKADQLMQLCDQLENQLTKAQRIAERLAQAAVASITGTQIKEKETMKAPKTELVTKLKLAASPKKNDQAPLASILAKHNGELSAKGLWDYSGLEIDGFYLQLKTEMARGWIVEPEKARVIEKAEAV